jgi:peptidoglycan/LPS O-acetylase OafA/YrhL
MQLIRSLSRKIAAIALAPSRIPSLDGLRAISIALVLFAHASGTQYTPSLVFLRRNLGNLGVRVFFIISGFLITSLLLKELDKTGRISLRHFYLRRFFRIFPAAYAYLLVLTVVFLIGTRDFELNDLIYGFTYTTNYDPVRPWLTIHLWSLAVEEQFYLLWPATLVLAGRERAFRIAAWVLLLSPLLRTLFFVYDAGGLRWTSGSGFFTNADSLAFGCILAGWRTRIFAWRPYRSLLESRWVALAPAAVMAITLLFDEKSRFLHVAGFSLMNLCITVSIDWAVRNHTGWIGRRLNSAPFVWLGVLSYSVYLWQEPFLNRLSSAWYCAFPVNLMLVFVCAIASFLLVEQPFLELRKRFEPKPAAREPELAGKAGA